MALVFNRPEMRAGVVVISEMIQDIGKDGKPLKDEKGQPVMAEKKYRFTFKDKGKKFEFKNEADVLKRYPHMFKKA